jgi:hypothetical protein
MRTPAEAKRAWAVRRGYVEPGGPPRPTGSLVLRGTLPGLVSVRWTLPAASGVGRAGPICSRPAARTPAVNEPNLRLTVEAEG